MASSVDTRFCLSPAPVPKSAVFVEVEHILGIGEDVPNGRGVWCRRAGIVAFVGHILLHTDRDRRWGAEQPCCMIQPRLRAAWKVRTAESSGEELRPLVLDHAMERLCSPASPYWEMPASFSSRTARRERPPGSGGVRVLGTAGRFLRVEVFLVDTRRGCFRQGLVPVMHNQDDETRQCPHHDQAHADENFAVDHRLPQQSRVATALTIARRSEYSAEDSILVCIFHTYPHSTHNGVAFRRYCEGQPPVQLDGVSDKTWPSSFSFLYHIFWRFPTSSADAVSSRLVGVLRNRDR